MRRRLGRQQPADARLVGPQAPGQLAHRGLTPRPLDGGGATDILFGRLTDSELAQIMERLDPSQRAIWDAASERERRRLALSFGLLHSVPGIEERTGLSAATPPREVHSMVHGWTTEIGGSYYLADLVFDTLDEIGRAPAPGDRVLDFSCSSGRVIRPLVAAVPKVSWYGCDPNEGAVSWLGQQVSDVTAVVSPTSPPLSFDDATFSLVFAVSVWSHYSAPAALAWLEELGRVVRPKGHVLLTTHGLQACAWFGQHPEPAIEQRLGSNWIAATADRLQTDGHCFWDVFGDEGDWGVVDSEWGLAFFTPEWLLDSITPAWAMRSYRIGGAHGNQDVYLLERA